MKSFTLASLLVLTTLTAFGQKIGAYHLDKEFPVNATGTLTLSSSDAHVVIAGDSRNTVHVRIDHQVIIKGISFGSSDFTMDIRNDNGNLDIKENSHSNIGMVGYSREEYKIVIEVPTTLNIVIRGDDGGYKLSSLSGKIGARVSDADIQLTGCTGNEFNFRMGDGKIKMDQGRGKLLIDGSDGDVFIEHGAFDAIEANVQDGGLRIATSLNEAGSYSLRAGDGTIALTVLGGSGGSFRVNHDDGHVATDGNFRVIEKSDDETRLTLSDGKAKVEIRVNDGRVRLASR